MIINRIVTAISLALLGLVAIYVVFGIISRCRSRERMLAFIRGFKMGKCAIVFVAAIPLYFIGHLYAGKQWLDAIFLAVHKVISLVVLGYDTSTVSALMDADPFYCFAMYACYAMVFINALMLAVSLTHQHISALIDSLRMFFTRKDRLIIFGNNDKNLMVYKSDEKREKMIVDDISQDAADKLFLMGVAHRSTAETGKLIDKVFEVIEREEKIKLKRARRLGKRIEADSEDRECIFIVNTLSTDKDIGICRALNARIAGECEQIRARLFHRIKIFVFGDRTHEDLFEDIVEESFGCVRFVNIHRAVAVDFVDKYPISAFMDQRHIDYKSSLVKAGVKLNMLLIGFGKANQQIFMTSVANNQFITAAEGEPALMPVNYYVFDKDNDKNDKCLNHNYHRFESEILSLSEKERENYLTLPKKPCEMYPVKCNVNDKEFYSSIRSIVDCGELGVNLIVVAYGSDLENLDMAKKLIEKRREWGIPNLTVFAKVRGDSAEGLIKEDGFHTIGGERQVVYNIDRITSSDLFRMGQMRNEVYDLEYMIREGKTVDEQTVAENREASLYSWYASKGEIKRESSIYCCLSLRSKLHMMGLDYCKDSEENKDKVGLSEDEYLAKYAEGDLPNREKYAIRANGKQIVSYNIDFKDSRRRNMAVQEHLRWNSFMISHGYVPADKSLIAEEYTVKADGTKKYTNGKNEPARRHGNLTTFSGLVDFRRMVAKRDGVDEEKKDVIMYDYQLLDDAHWLLSKNGYKIISRENNN